MNTLEEVIEQFKEVKIWKKKITQVAVLLMAVGVVVGAIGIFVQSIWWAFVVPGVAIVIVGALLFFISRNAINKTERMIIETLDNAKIPEDQREKLKAELQLK